MTSLKYSDLVDSGLFVKVSTKGQSNGVASLDSNGVVPVAQLGTGSYTNQTFLRGDGTWATPAGGTGGSSTTTYSLTISATGNGANAPVTFDGSIAKTISWNSVGAASSSHTHGSLTTDGKIGSTAGLVVVTGANGALQAKAAGASGEFLASDGNWATPVGGIGGSKQFTFRVNFESGGAGAPISFESVPTGWLPLPYIEGDYVVVTHNVNSYPKYISYLGYDSGQSAYIYKYPTGSDFLIPNATLNSKFKFKISTFIASASYSAHAMVTVIF